jgi:DNA primase
VKLVKHEGEKIEYIEVTAADIELATKLLADVLVHPDDELPPVTRNVLAAIEAFVTEKATTTSMAISEVRFTKRELRKAVGIGHTQTKIHLRRLEEMEYIRAHREKKTFRFCLGYDAGRAGLNVVVRESGGHRAGVEPVLSGIRDGRGTSASSPSVGPSGAHVNGEPDKTASYRT